MCDIAAGVRRRRRAGYNLLVSPTLRRCRCIHVCSLYCMSDERVLLVKTRETYLWLCDSHVSVALILLSFVFGVFVSMMLSGLARSGGS